MATIAGSMEQNRKECWRISGENASHVLVAYCLNSEESSTVARRCRLSVEMPFVDGSCESRPSLRRRMRSVAVLGVEKNPPEVESQNRRICCSEVHNGVSINKFLYL